MTTQVQLTKERILELLKLLDAELASSGTRAEIHLVGGAVMCLAFNARPSTRDLDASLEPTKEVREAAARVAAKADAPDGWLSDAVKGFLSPKGDFDPYLELPNLSVFIARPEYLLAMKCVAMRLGEEFHDLDDIRYLLRYLNVGSVDAALEIVTRYYDEARLLPKTRLALEELLTATAL